MPCDISNAGAKLASSRSREKHPGLHTHLWSSNPASRSTPKTFLQCSVFRKLNNSRQGCTWMWHFFVDADVSSDFLAAAMTGRVLHFSSNKTVGESACHPQGASCPERHCGCRASRVPGSRITERWPPGLTLEIACKTSKMTNAGLRRRRVSIKTRRRTAYDWTASSSAMEDEHLPSALTNRRRRTWWTTYPVQSRAEQLIGPSMSSVLVLVDGWPHKSGLF